MVQTLPEGGSGEGGLLGVAVSPNYEEDRYVYAYYTTERDNRVVRFRIGEEPEPVLTGIPVNSYHDGGRIKFGPDGMLYISTGHAGDTENSQDRGSLGGKILRIEPDGSIPKDNPFAGNPVYSYGHRNVEGLAWDAEGQLYASEFGQNTWDEVNRIEAGENYGWPEVEGRGGEDRGYVDPITVWPTSEASPSGAEIMVDGAIPQWEGDLFVAALRGERLWHLELNDKGHVTDREKLLDGEVGRVRDVAQAPDGSLWVSTSNYDTYGNPVSEQDDRILRLARRPGNRMSPVEDTRALRGMLTRLTSPSSSVSGGTRRGLVRCPIRYVGGPDLRLLPGQSVARGGAGREFRVILCDPDRLPPNEGPPGGIHRLEFPSPETASTSRR